MEHPFPAEHCARAHGVRPVKDSFLDEETRVQSTQVQAQFCWTLFNALSPLFNLLLHYSRIVSWMPPFLCVSALSPLAMGSLSCVHPAADPGVAAVDRQQTQAVRGQEWAEAAWALEQEGRFQIPQLLLPKSL